VAAPWLSGLIRRAESRLGVTLIETEELAGVQETLQRQQAFIEEAGEMGYHSLGYFQGRPHELRHESRQRLAQRSRVAILEDPLAGAEADLLANFAFGRGVAMPDAEDEEVQRVIEEAWTDPNNDEKLTGFEAQRHRSTELRAQANLFPVAYVKGGRVRLGFLDADTVKFIVADPEDEERPLWYATTKRRQEWDFENDRLKTVDQMGSGRPQIVYFPHWRNVEALEADGATVQRPPRGKLGEGLVYHVRTNRIGRTQFGAPPYARTLRFFRAMNDLTEAHVVMAQAASTFVAKQSMTGTPQQLTAERSQALSQTGELGAARFGAAQSGDAFPRQVAPPPGAFWLENDANRLEPLNLRSGAGEVAQTAQIVRAPIAASSQFGQHYLGDASNATDATATSLELPTLMAVQAWQQTMKDMLDWFVTLVIQEAVRAGRLGGYGAVLSESEAEEAGVPARVAGRPLSGLSISEAEDRREMERRTGKSLTYTLDMPYPGRRNLPDVVSTVGTIVTAFDPQGVNLPLRRAMLTFLATHGMQIEDPQKWVDEVMPEDAAEASKLLPGYDMATGDPYVDPRSADYQPPEPAPGASGGTRAGAAPSGSGSPSQQGRRPPRREMGARGGSSREGLLEEDLGTLWDRELLGVGAVNGRHR
jgi:hypothetical protein